MKLPGAEVLDSETQTVLSGIAGLDPVKGKRIPGVRIVLVVLSSEAIVFDVEALKQKVLLAYPDSTVFFITTCGKALGAHAPRLVDLLIDLTGPGQKQSLFFAKRMRRGARVAVGRNAGLFRKRIYDRIFDDRKGLPKTLGSQSRIERERLAQKEVLAMAGVALVPSGDPLPDLGKEIGLEHPWMRRA